MATSTARYNLRQPEDVDSVDTLIDIATPYATIDSNLARVDDAVLGTETSRWNRRVDQAGTLFTTSSNTEADIAKLAITGINIKKDRCYHFLARVYGINPTVVNDDFYIRIRRTTAVTGTEILKQANFIDVTFLDHVLQLSGFWVPTVDIASENFYVSIKREVGSGAISIIGDSQSMLSMWVDPPTITNTQLVT